MEMKPYGDLNNNSGIIGYAIDDYDTCMDIEFANGGIYTYRRSNVGEANFAVMKALAIAGSGLNAFINKNVRLKGFKRFRPKTFTFTACTPKEVEMLSEMLRTLGITFSIS